MNLSVYLRPLQLDDALVSWQWRNNSKLWKYTGAKPDGNVTPEKEREMLAKVLKNEDQRRFAICLLENDKYIGNVSLTDIQNGQALVNIFIGEMAYWGKGRAYEALILTAQYGFETLKVDTIRFEINKKNTASLALWKTVGGQEIGEYYNDTLQAEFVKVVFTRAMYEQQLHLESLRKKSS